MLISFILMYQMKIMFRIKTLSECEVVESNSLKQDSLYLVPSIQYQALNVFLTTGIHAPDVTVSLMVSEIDL